MKISIITPSYNQGHYIEATIQSVLHQLPPVDEYIIVDGLSTDTTQDILKRYQHQAVIIAEKDCGQTEALNKGFRYAHHEIIGWLNSDDVYTPQAISLIKKIFEEDPTIDVVYGKAFFIDAQGKKIGQYPVEKLQNNALLTDCVLCQPAVFFKKALLEKYGFLDETLRFCMDYEWWLRLAKAGVKFQYIPHFLAEQRLHTDTKTATLALEANAEVCDLYKKYSLSLPLHRFLRYAWLYHKKKPLSFTRTLRELSRQYHPSWNKKSIQTLLMWILKKLKMRLKKIVKS